MTDINAAGSKFELLALQSVLKLIAEKPPHMSRRRGFWPLLILAIVVGIAASLLDLSILKHPVVTAVEPLVALALGVVVTYLALRSATKAQFFFITPYIDRAAVEARLRELGP